MNEVQLSKEYKCIYCNKICKNLNSKHNHERVCKENPNRQPIEQYVRASGKWRIMMQRRLADHTGVNAFIKARKLGLPVPPSPLKGKPGANKGKKHTDETKQKISKAMKKFFASHPEKYFWRNKDKFKSVPCEKLKEILKKDYSFVEEYTDTTWEHNYSLDIAFLDKKLAIEVNGTQHYDKEGNLAPYYQKRHEYLESQGWLILEVHYARCFKGDEIAKIKNAIDERKQIPEEEYKILFQNRRKTKEEKLLEQQEKRRKAETEGRISKTNRILSNGLTTQEWNDRKEKILNSGINITKYGWITKVIKFTGLTKREIEGTINHFKKEFKDCKFTKRKVFN